MTQKCEFNLMKPKSFFQVRSRCRQGSAVTVCVHQNFKLNVKIEICTYFKQLLKNQEEWAYLLQKCYKTFNLAQKWLSYCFKKPQFSLKLTYNPNHNLAMMSSSTFLLFCDLFCAGTYFLLRAHHYSLTFSTKTLGRVRFRVRQVRFGQTR